MQRRQDFQEDERIAPADAQRLAELLVGPAAWWRNRVLDAAATRTAGFVRALLERAVELSDKRPNDAIEATAIAVEIANELPEISLRAEALREHAFALSFVGRYPEALSAVDRAQPLTATGIDLARLWVTRALIYRSTDRVPEAIALTREAAEVFRTFGVTDRYVKARMTEAAMLHQQGSIREALEIWTSLETEASLANDASYGMLLQNIGITCAQLGELDRAHDYLGRALAEHEKRGVEPEAIRTRWSMASTLVAGGRLSEALPLLRRAWREFDALELRVAGALVGLEIAEVLLMLNQPDEVPAICRRILDEFTRNGMTSRAITALSFLREAVALGKATPTLIRHIRDFIRAIPENPARNFTLPAF